MNGLHNGDVVNLTHFTHVLPQLQIGFKAEKGKVFKMLILGIADRKDPDPDTFNAMEAVRSLGWFAGDDIRPLMERAIADTHCKCLDGIICWRCKAQELLSK